MSVALLGALVGGGASIAGGLIGADAQEEANEKNWQINLLNYYARERERRDRIRETENIRRDQHLGATDAAGNSTKFVEGKGWVSELGPQDKLINSLQKQEQQQVLQHDLPARRAKMDENLGAQREERWTADNLLDRFGREAEADPEAIRRTMQGAAMGAINREYDEILSSAMRTANRQGNSNVGQIITDMAKSRMHDIAGTMANIPMQAQDIAQQRTSAQQGRLSNLYNMFATRSGQMPGTSYQPQNIEGQSSHLLDRFSQYGQQGNDLVSKAYAQQGGTIDYTRPNTGYGDAIASGGSALAAGLNRMDAYGDRQKAVENTTRW